MKKIASIAVAFCLVFAFATSAFAEQAEPAKTHGKHHVKSHHKARAKAHGKTMKIKAVEETPTMPKTGHGGASE